METCIERVCKKHLMIWMGKSNVATSTSLPNRKEFIQGFLSAVGIEDVEIQKVLKEEIGLGYQCGVGEAIFTMVTAHPDIAHAITQFSQHNSSQHRTFFCCTEAPPQISVCHAL